VALLNHELICFNCMGALEAPGAVCRHCGHDNRVRTNGPGYLQATVLQNQYFVGRALGRGGFGITYIGFDLNLQRVVAIKEYFPSSLIVRDGSSFTVRPFDKDDTEAFEHGCKRALEEGILIARSEMVSNVVQVYSAFPAHGTIYIVMEYIPGSTLTRIVKENGPLNWQQSYRLMRPIMEALCQMHSQGIIHRDISPDNVMKRRNSDRTVLLDFGAAHSYTETNEHSVSLRPGFAPPEQYNGKAAQDGRTDEYAVCATLYFLLTGRKPVDSTARVYGGAKLETPRELGVKLPSDIEQVLLKGMELKPERRYQTVAEMMKAFDRATGVKTQTKEKKAPVVLIILLAALAVAAAAGFMLVRNNNKQKADDRNLAVAASEQPDVTAVPTAEPTKKPGADIAVQTEEGRVSVSWNADGASRYDVRISAVDSEGSIVEMLVEVTDTQSENCILSTEELDATAVYAVEVIAYDTNGKVISEGTREFGID